MIFVCGILVALLVKTHTMYLLLWGFMAPGLSHLYSFFLQLTIKIKQK